MESTKNIIEQLKKVYKERNLSYDKIRAMIEANGDFAPSKSTLSRMFSDDSDAESFSYEATIRPIANALLDIEEIEEDDNADTGAMKALLKYKMDRIEELERALAEEKVKYHEKLDIEREQSRRSIEFLKEQIALKDKRMDLLLEAVFTKDAQHKELLDTILSCPARQNTDCTEV